MPIYEYQCSKCGHLEIFQRITEKPLVRCPTCQRKVTKLISQSSFHLKGSGWYMTDYARKSGSEIKSDAKSDTKSDTKSSSSDTSKGTEGGKATCTAESSDRSSSPTKDSGGSSTKESGSSSPASGKMSGAGSAAV
jgi:putative FmdB family regulatory protein